MTELPVFSIAGVAWLEPGASTALAQTDCEHDDDLIEVDSLAKLNAIGRDLDGDSSSTDAGDALAFPDPATDMGCQGSVCTGYELIADLDFDTDVSGAARPSLSQPAFEGFGPMQPVIRGYIYLPEQVAFQAET